MGARELLSDLTAAGFALVADGGNVVIRPSSKLTDEVRAAVRAAKPDLLVLLAQAPAGEPVPARVHRHGATQPPDDEKTQPVRAREDLDDAARARFLDRRDRLIAWGNTADEAEALALRLAQRDAEQDDRRLCTECRHLERGGRCSQARRGRMLAEGIGRHFEPPRTVLQRCPQFEPVGRP